MANENSGIGTAGLVRSFLRIRTERYRFTGPKLAAELGITTIQARQVLSDMIRRGEVERTGPATYRYIGVELGRRESKIRAGLLRQMHMKRSFTVADLLNVSGADPSYTHKLVAGLVEAGDLERGGKIRIRRGIYRAQFVVRDPDGFYKKHVLRR